MRAIRWLASGSVLMLLAVVLGLATVSATFAWLQQQETAETGLAAAAADDDVPMREVVVVLEDITAGTRLPEVMLAVRSIPVTDALAGAYATQAEAAGRIARYPLIAGEQVTESKLVRDEGETGRGLAYAVAPGMRAVSVSVNEITGAGGLMVPGDRVDVMVVTTRERVFGTVGAVDDNETDEIPTVVTVLQDVLVLAVGQEITPPADGGRDPATLRDDGVDPQPGAQSVTLAVSPDEAQALFMASQEGPLGFAVRAFGDASQSLLTPLSKVEPAAATAQVNRAP